MISLVLIAVTLLLSLAAVLYLHGGRSPKHTRSVPGMAPTDKRAGNIPDIAAAGDTHRFLVKLHENYGPIASFWFGARYAVSIASPELFKEQMGLFDRPPEIFDIFRPMSPNSVEFANKADGKERRRIYDKPFSQESLKYYYEAFNESANGLVRKLASLPGGEHVPLTVHCHAVVIRALVQTSFGDFFRDEANILKFCRAYDTCWHDMEASLAEGLPVEGSDRRKKFNEALTFLQDTVREAVKERKENPTVGHQVFIDVLIENELPEDQVQDDCITFMVGGFHTSGNLMVWALYYLSQHPECQAKLYREIQEVVGSGEVECSHLQNLTYLRRVLDESLRMSALAPYSARFDDNESMLGGYVIPPRTPVVQALGVVLHDEVLWPEPMKFDPERFCKGRMTPRHHAAFKPFGFAGKRLCPGQHFFYAEVTVFLAALCRAFRFRPVPGQLPVEAVYGLVTKPKEEIWVILEKRA